MSCSEDDDMEEAATLHMAVFDWVGISKLISQIYHLPVDTSNSLIPCEVYFVMCEIEDFTGYNSMQNKEDYLFLTCVCVNNSQILQPLVTDDFFIIKGLQLASLTITGLGKGSA